MIYIIGGQTASGKTGLALRFASLIGGEIINGDAFQVYRGLDIGTAKPTKEEQQIVHHHLFDIIDVDHKFSIFEYQKLAREKIDELLAKHIPVIIVGGSGLYIRSVLLDYQFTESKYVDMSSYEVLSNEVLHDELKKIDPESATKIHSNNRRRVLRAIEIYLQNGISKSELEKSQRKEPLYPYTLVTIELDSETLDANIKKRVQKMFELGLRNELKTMLEKYSETSPGFTAIGYKEIIENRDLDDEALIEMISLNTRQYAKRQKTFFNNQFAVHSFKDVESALNFLLQVHKGV